MHRESTCPRFDQHRMAQEAQTCTMRFNNHSLQLWTNKTKQQNEAAKPSIDRFCLSLSLPLELADRRRSGFEFMLIRLLFLLSLASICGCTNATTDGAGENLIRIGDDTHEARRKLERWSAVEGGGGAFAIGIQEDEESKEDFKRRVDKLRQQNDFIEHPYYRLPSKVTVHFQALNGKIVAISQFVVLGPHAGNSELKTGFTGVDAHGRFTR
jgi:hypothetical protein